MRLNHFFYLPRSDRRVLLSLLTIAAVAGGIYFFLGKEANLQQSTDDNDAVDTTFYTKSNKKQHTFYQYDEANDRVIELFAFDPNTADSLQLQRLGLSKYLIRNLYKYRNRGGYFPNKESFSRLYGLTEAQYRRLEPYITISKDYQQATPRYAKTEQLAATRDSMTYPTKLKVGETIALNASDTSQLKKVPGVGSAFARAIINYRERLGGFVSVSQLHEIKELPDDVVDYFRIDHRPVKQLNVNRLSVNQLRRHPYLTFVQAKAITDYRRLKGNIKSIEDLRLMKEFTADDLMRLQPYLSF